MERLGNRRYPIDDHTSSSARYQGVGRVHPGHLTKRKIGHLANYRIPHLADVGGGFLLYTGCGRRAWLVLASFRTREYPSLGGDKTIR